MTLERFFVTAETRPAWLAVKELLADVQSTGGTATPLYVHGPSGVGKTHLADCLAQETRERLPDATVVSMHGIEAALLAQDDARFQEAQSATLWIVEDLHQLASKSEKRPAVWEALARVFDLRLVERGAMLFTAPLGPGRLIGLPRRMQSRLSGGLVVAMEALGAGSRLALLQHFARQRKATVSATVLGWLADHIPGTGRQLLGALNQVETMARMRREPIDVDTVAEAFREQEAFSHTTVERIAERVAVEFQVEVRHMQSRKRFQNVVLPRQVSMYLARRLTRLSLEQIGAYFGGRDHTTVMHAIRKIEQALAKDPALDGVIRQLTAELQ